MKTSSNRGFTLIELLVVIAIIGILSSVVLASLNSARNKGGDAAVKANLANIRAQAAIYYDTNNSYVTTAVDSTACTNTLGGIFNDTTFAAGVQAAKSAGGGTANCAATVGASGAWAVKVNLKSDSASYVCVDSAGVSATSSSAAIGASALCN